MSTETQAAVAVPIRKSTQVHGMRVNGEFSLQIKVYRLSETLTTKWGVGKQWHEPKSAFRPKAGNTSYEKRLEARKAAAAVKAKEREMKEEKEAERQRRVQAIKDKRAAKEEKARYEKLAETMHRKRVERLKRKEKRNKLLNS
ncbi:Cgr1 family-domain-containing protein [Xylogone sp. PMI_703]|nr:Cgr1 family-domain-containing protein [Xylogone sp. PMI_703]